MVCHHLGEGWEGQRNEERKSFQTYQKLGAALFGEHEDAKTGGEKLVEIKT